MDLIEEWRDALHLVQNHGTVSRQVAKLQGEQSGIGQECLVARLVQEVDKMGFREMVTSPRALAHSADTEQEEAAFGRRDQARVSMLCNHVVILPGKMTIWCTSLGFLFWRPGAAEGMKVLNNAG